MRTDIPLAAQIVQAGHACLEAGSRFPQPSGESCNLVVLAVESQFALLQAVERADRAGISMAVFYEPDGCLGYTAACSQPVSGDQRRVFRRYPLWQAPSG